MKACLVKVKGKTAFDRREGRDLKELDEDESGARRRGGEEELKAAEKEGGGEYMETEDGVGKVRDRTRRTERGRTERGRTECERAECGRAEYGRADCGRTEWEGMRAAGSILH